MLLLPALSSLPFPQEVQLLSSLHLQILQWPVTTWDPSSNRKDGGGWKLISFILLSKSYWKKGGRVFRETDETAWVFLKSSCLQVHTTEQFTYIVPSIPWSPVCYAQEMVVLLSSTKLCDWVSGNCIELPWRLLSVFKFYKSKIR